MLKRIVLILAVCFFLGAQVWAQDFGFGFDEEDSGGASGAGSKPRLSLSVGGEVSAAIVGYFYDMSKGAKHIDTREMFMLQGKLNFHAQSPFAEGVINLKFVPALIPVSIDEAYIRAYFGNFDLSAGLKKVVWGKADQFGPLDVINMIDASKVFLEMADNTSLLGVKLANPVVHAAFRFGKFSKIEGIVLPSFEIINAAISAALTPPNPANPMALLIGSTAERWIPTQMSALKDAFDGALNMPGDGSMLSYAQAGLRFTSTIGSADVGAQYFFGRMLQPAVRFSPNKLDPSQTDLNVMFNKYHQIGIDYAQVLAGFNVRAEVAANITEDVKGDDGYTYNPSIGWSVGFDRDLFLGINLNLQVNESIRLLDSKVGSDDPASPKFDIESGLPITATRLTAMLSRKFLRDELELRTAVVWGIEDKDAAVIPALIWTKDDLRVALSGSFFMGDTEGQLGQYNDKKNEKVNNFLKISVLYVF